MGEPEFPPCLQGLAKELWVRGDVEALRVSPRVTVVGSRAASERGQKRAWALGQELGGRGALVVSVGALGIDAAAHQGALESGEAMAGEGVGS